MAKLMWICGILLFAAGLALGLIVLVSAVPTKVTLDTAAILLVGGVLAAGLGSVIDALNRRPLAAQAAAQPQAMVAETAPAPTAIPEFGGRTAAKAAGIAAVAAVVAEPETPAPAASEEVSEPTRDTIVALEEARQKIEQAFDAKTPAAEEAVGETPSAAALPAVVEEEEPMAEDIAFEEETMEEGQLYVVEERIIRRRPARILSDGTVEAETEEGWMRFENLEHLDEYLDAMEPAKG